MTYRRASLAAWPLAALLFLSPAAARGETKKPMVLAATIFPAADIVRRVAGPEVRVIQVLPPGASPHTFDLTPGLIRQLQDVRLVFKIGGMDDWIDGVTDSLPRAAMITLDKGIALKPFHEQGHAHVGHEAGHGPENDPHYWLSAANGAVMAHTVAGALSAADPAHAGRYQENYRRLARELSALHRQLQKELSVLARRQMIVFHDGWRYFAAAYDLEIAAVFQAAPGRDPSPRELQGLYAQARRLRIRAVFSEPQLPAASLQPLLQDLGLRLIVLDPLGGATAGDSYAALLRRIALAVREGLEN
jgi:zinc transport system substrate-binding protein